MMLWWQWDWYVLYMPVGMQHDATLCLRSLQGHKLLADISHIVTCRFVNWDNYKPRQAPLQRSFRIAAWPMISVRVQFIYLIIKKNSKTFWGEVLGCSLLFLVWS